MDYKRTNSLLFIIIVSSILFSGCIGCSKKCPSGKTEVIIKLTLLPKSDASRDLSANILFNNKLVGSVENRTSTRICLPTGEHTVELKLDGYNPDKKSVEIVETQYQEFYFTLNELHNNITGNKKILNPIFSQASTNYSVNELLKFLKNFSSLGTKSDLNERYRSPGEIIEFKIDGKRKCNISFTICDKVDSDTCDINTYRSYMKQKKSSADLLFSKYSYVKVNFADLNPNSIKIDDSDNRHFEIFISVRVTNNAKKIFISKGTMRECYNEYLCFYVTRKKHAEKVKNAVEHLIVKCGGKKDMF